VTDYPAANPFRSKITEAPFTDFNDMPSSKLIGDARTTTDATDAW
jgi:hypothetical protein